MGFQKFYRKHQDEIELIRAYWSIPFILPFGMLCFILKSSFVGQIIIMVFPFAYVGGIIYVKRKIEK